MHFITNLYWSYLMIVSVDVFFCFGVSSWGFRSLRMRQSDKKIFVVRRKKKMTFSRRYVTRRRIYGFKPVFCERWRYFPLRAAQKSDKALNGDPAHSSIRNGRLCQPKTQNQFEFLATISSFEFQNGNENANSFFSKHVLCSRPFYVHFINEIAACVFYSCEKCFVT